ncbi:unnamed protein product [Angiostrongylus costaricensis]|uniref:Uncharacterized protein n=1 Tax=Angiostrongylus costaricensis TaxID=334426 RepID=A0A0R3PNC6_ANGCS|nr:unnamed protein product [Angiostrongylus costaricensis]
MNTSSGSVPRSQRQTQQQHVNLFGSSGSTSAPPTPRSRKGGCRRPNRRPISFTSRLSGSPCYAGSKFSDSPTARAIPLPPTEWLYDAYNTQSDNTSMGSNVGAQVDMETSSTCSSAPSLNDVGEVTVLPAELQKSGLRPSSGMRVHPLRLIAAVSAS